MLPRAAIAAASLLLVAGCTGAPSEDETAPPAPTDSPTATPEPSGTADAFNLPQGAVLGLAVTAAAPPGGGSARILLVVRPAVAAGDPDAAVAVARTVATCPGEFDEATLIDQAFSFVPVQVSIEPQDWSGDLFLDLMPRPSDGTTVAVDGELRQAEDVGDEPAAYVPRCLQPALTAGTGGTFFVGVPGTGAEPTSAVPQFFGVDAGETGVELRDCQVVFGDGIDPDRWLVDDTASRCAVGPDD